jgi:phosphate transport system protein
VRDERRRLRHVGQELPNHPLVLRIQEDDVLDAKNEGVIRQLLTYMAETPALISHSLELISVSKNLERVGDLATNIAEDTIFIAEAKLVKHHGVELAGT